MVCIEFSDSVCMLNREMEQHSMVVNEFRIILESL